MQVPTVRGTAVLYEDDDPEYSTVMIKRADGGEEKAVCRKLIICTGSSPMRPGTIPYDDIRVFDSGALAFSHSRTLALAAAPVLVSRCFANKE